MKVFDPATAAGAPAQEAARQAHVEREHRQRLIVARYERLRKSMVLDACAIAVPSSQAAGAQLIGVLGCLPRMQVGPLVEYGCGNEHTALWIQRAVESLFGPGRCGVLRRRKICHIVLSEDDLELAAPGYRGGQWLNTSKATTALSVVRGAIAATGTLGPDGMHIYGPQFQPLNLIAEAVKRCGVPAQLCESKDEVFIARGAVLGLLDVLGMIRTARGYARTVQASAANGIAVRLELADEAKAMRRAATASVQNPVFEAIRIYALGDLERYRLSALQSSTAAHALAAYSLSGAEAAAAARISQADWQRRLESFWGAIERSKNRPRNSRRRPERAGILPPQFESANQSRARASSAAALARLNDLGDFKETVVSQSLREAAEMRMAYPEASYAELGARLGVSKDVYAGRLRRFWRAVNSLDRAR